MPEPQILEVHSSSTIGPMVRDYKSAFHPLTGLQHVQEEQFLHRLDAFFAAHESEYTVKGYVTHENRQVVAIEHQKRIRVHPRFEEGRMYELQETATALLDPSRGYLPLRITYVHDKLLDGQRVDEESPHPFRVVECTEVQQFGSGYYPVRGIEEFFSVDPSSEQFVIGTAEQFAEKGHLPPVVVAERIPWSVSLLDVTPEMQGKRILSCRQAKELRQVCVIPTSHSALHSYALLAGALLDQAYRETF